MAKQSKSTIRFSAEQKKGVRISMKDALLECFVGMGGSPALVRWAKANPSEAYKLIAKHTIPTRMELGGLDGEAIRMEMTNAAASARRKIDSTIARDAGENSSRPIH